MPILPSVAEQAHGEKQTLRARLRDALRRLNSDQIKQRSASCCHRLTELPEFAEAQALMLFLPLRHEVDASAIALRAWQQNKLVTVPLVSLEQRHMIPVAIRSLTEPMQTDALGVRTPMAGEPIPIELIDLLIVPGLAFDRRGHRLGRGGGFYDRFMAKPAYRACSCGLAFDDQVLDRVPTNTHDVAIDMLVTDQQVLRFATGQKRGE